jgi:NAD(P)-dependent dehydrogenase (short-subunit alcohol dehydrogenase family)
MKPRSWGRIVNVASASGFRASLARTAYGTSKAAVIGLTRQMAVELAPLGITANAIAPGPVDTPMTREFQSPVMRRNLIRGIPAGRYGTPEEMAAMVSFLASEDAAYVTGHTFPVDGGLLAAGVLEI